MSPRAVPSLLLLVVATGCSEHGVDPYAARERQAAAAADDRRPPAELERELDRLESELRTAPPAARAPSTTKRPDGRRRLDAKLSDDGPEHRDKSKDASNTRGGGAS